MVCAWCHALIGPDRPRAGFEHNYGMCPSCVAEQLGRLAPLVRRHPLARGKRNRLPFRSQPSYDSACSGEGALPRSG
jgi:hypothetical protein